MSKMSDLHLQISDEIYLNSRTPSEIACKLHIPAEWIESVYDDILFDIDNSPSFLYLENRNDSV